MKDLKDLSTGWSYDEQRRTTDNQPCVKNFSHPFFDKKGFSFAKRRQVFFMDRPQKNTKNEEK